MERLGTVANNCVALTKVVGVALVLPKETTSAEPKFVPVIVTWVPGVPEAGEMFVIVGAPVDDDVYVNPLASAAVKLPGF